MSDNSERTKKIKVRRKKTRGQKIREWIYLILCVGVNAVIYGLSVLCFSNNWNQEGFFLMGLLGATLTATFSIILILNLSEKVHLTDIIDADIEPTGTMFNCSVDGVNFDSHLYIGNNGIVIDAPGYWLTKIEWQALIKVSIHDNKLCINTEGASYYLSSKRSLQLQVIQDLIKPRIISDDDNY